MEQQRHLFPERGRGTYVLILPLQTATTLTIGRLGMYPFAAGWYTYVGSAFGAGGLGGRLGHHLNVNKRLHWHVDYLTQHTGVAEIWYGVSDTIYEHHWAGLLGTLSEQAIPVQRFGASDCTCRAHLFYFATRPSYDVFREAAQVDVQQWTP